MEMEIEGREGRKDVKVVEKVGRRGGVSREGGGEGKGKKRERKGKGESFVKGRIGKGRKKYEK